MSLPADPHVFLGRSSLPLDDEIIKDEIRYKMTISHLHILPPENPVPSVASMPDSSSRRWCSHNEDPGFNPHIQVFVAQPAYLCLAEHSASDLESEVGGILVGTWSVDAEQGQEFIVVETALPARFTRQGSVYLTFTQDSLVDLHAEMDEHYPDKQIVGWYHTHPGMGVFLSSYDAWLHQHFFPEQWQVALVIDPISAAGGFFIRQVDGVLDPARCFGFHELNGKSGQSFVRWNNLHQESTDTENKGVDVDE
jgi:proteasome lid subunit RPN8/RPN11